MRSRIAPCGRLPPRWFGVKLAYVGLQQREVLRKGDLRLGELRVPLLLPFDRDEIVIAALLEQPQSLAYGDLTLAQREQLPDISVAPRILQMHVEHPVADQTQH